MNEDFKPMHEGECRPIVGQRNSTCSFCFCESSWGVEGVVTCWACARAIVLKFWQDMIAELETR